MDAELEEFRQCAAEGCRTHVWPPHLDARCVAHGGSPKAEYATNEYGLTTYSMPDLPDQTWHEGEAQS